MQLKKKLESQQITALYEILSRDDDLVGECNPIVNQYENKSAESPSLKKVNNDHYSCSTYNNGLKKFELQCSRHYISTLALRELILEAIKGVSKYAIENEKEFVNKVRGASAVQQRSAAKALQSRLKREKKRCKELDCLIKKLYEAYATGKLAEKRFEMLSAEYEREQAGLEESIVGFQAEFAEYEADINNIEQFLILVKNIPIFQNLRRLC